LSSSLSSKIFCLSPHPLSPSPLSLLVAPDTQLIAFDASGSCGLATPSILPVGIRPVRFLSHQTLDSAASKSPFHDASTNFLLYARTTSLEYRNSSPFLFGITCGEAACRPSTIHAQRHAPTLRTFLAVHTETWWMSLLWRPPGFTDPEDFRWMHILEELNTASAASFTDNTTACS
jgi:hypothetical protein